MLVLGSRAGRGAGGAGRRGEVLDKVTEDLGELSIGAGCAKSDHLSDSVFPTLLILGVRHNIAGGMTLAAHPDKGVPSGAGWEIGVRVLMDLRLLRSWLLGRRWRLGKGRYGEQRADGAQDKYPKKLRHVETIGTICCPCPLLHEYSP